MASSIDDSVLPQGNLGITGADADQGRANLGYAESRNAFKHPLILSSLDYSVLYDDIKGTWSNQRRQSACCKFVAIDKGCCPIKNSMPDIEDYASYCFEKEKCPSNDTFKRPHKLYLAKVERKHKKLKMVEE